MKRRKFISMFDLSPTGASWAYAVFTTVAVITGIVTGFGGLGIWWASGWRDYHADIKAREQRAEIEENKRQTAVANATAALAHEGQAKANERAEIANREAALASERAAEANKLAAIANEGQAKANQLAGEAHERAAALEKEASAAKLTLESERKERLAMEAIVAPRRISDPAAIIEKLKPFSGVNLVFQVVDREGQMVAFQLSDIAKAAGWNPGVIDVITGDMAWAVDEGITLEVAVNARDGDTRTRTFSASTVLMEELVAQGIEAKDGHTITPWIARPPNTIRATIGVKPLSYADTPEMKKWKEDRQKEYVERARYMREKLERSQKIADEERQKAAQKAADEAKKDETKPAKTAVQPAVKPEPTPDNP
jgi:hypothetical protein